MERTNNAKPLIPMDTTHDEAREIMFGWSNECNACRKPIEKIEDANAILMFRAQLWKLVHKVDCTASVMFSTRRGISPQAHRRLFK